jgi:hypothetical protein
MLATLLFTIVHYYSSPFSTIYFYSSLFIRSGGQIGAGAVMLSTSYVPMAADHDYRGAILLMLCEYAAWYAA